MSTVYWLCATRPRQNKDPGSKANPGLHDTQANNSTTLHHTRSDYHLLSLVRLDFKIQLINAGNLHPRHRHNHLRRLPQCPSV